MYQKWIHYIPWVLGFSTSRPFTCGSREFFVVGACPVHCRMLSSIPGLHQLNASSTIPQLRQPKVSADIAQCHLGNDSATHPKRSTHCLRTLGCQSLAYPVRRGGRLKTGFGSRLWSCCLAQYSTHGRPSVCIWINEWMKINEWKWTPKSCLAWWVNRTAFTQPPTFSAPLSPSKTHQTCGPVVIQSTIFLNVAFSKVNILLGKKCKERFSLEIFL